MLIDKSYETFEGILIITAQVKWTLKEILMALSFFPCVLEMMISLKSRPNVV